MNHLEVVRQAMQEVFDCRDSRDGVVVTTHCMYPTGTLVQLVVRGGENMFYVSDVPQSWTLPFSATGAAIFLNALLSRLQK